MASNSWASVLLGDLLRIKHGYAFKGEHFASQGDYVLLTPGNFRPDGGLVAKGDGEKYYAGQFPDEFLLRQGDLLVVMTDLTQSARILGSPAFVPRSNRYLHNQRLGKVVGLDHERIDARFLYHLLNTEAVRAQIRATATGATVRHTAPERIYSVKACIPPLPVQERIADILGAYDDLIENNLRRIRILEEMARSLYREWFVEFRYPGHERDRLVESPIGPVPEGWEVTTVGEASVNFDRQRRPLSGMERAQRPGPYPYYGAAKQVDAIDGYLLEGDYLLVAEDGSVQTADGTPVLQRVTGRFWVSNHAHVLQGKPPFSTEVLCLALDSMSIAPYVTGAAQPKVTQSALNRMRLPSAPVRLMDRFHATVLPPMSLSSSLAARNVVLSGMRDRTLSRLAVPQGKRDAQTVQPMGPALHDPMAS